MYRPALLLLALALALGCKKGNTDKPAPAANESGGVPNSGGLSTAELPKLQPTGKFKLAGERASSDRAVQLSDDGKTLAVVCTDPGNNRVVKVLTVSGEPKTVGEFGGHTFALSPSGRLLATSGQLSPAVFDVSTRKPVAKLPLLFSHVFFRDDHILVWTTRSYNFPQATKGKIGVWDVDKNADAGSFDIPDNRFDAAYPANGGKEIWLTMSNNKFEVECYDVAGKALLRTVKPENNRGRPYTSAGIWFSVASDASVFAANTSKLDVFDATTGKIVGELPADLWSSATGLLPGGTRYLARAGKQHAGLSENDYVVYNWKAKKAVAVVVGHSAGQKEPLAAVSGDGKTLVSVSKDGEGLVFDISSVK